MKLLRLVLLGSCMLNAAAAFIPLLSCPSLHTPSLSSSSSPSALASCRQPTLALRCSADSVESEVERRRQQYLRDRAERERTLLAEGANGTGESVYENKDPDVVPEYIARWGGADLAQEGPTRVTLELMNDSEWCVDHGSVSQALVTVCVSHAFLVFMSHVFYDGCCIPYAVSF
eukprot:1630451-Rhodomonas_salina.1